VFVDWREQVRGGTPPLHPEDMTEAITRYNAVPAGSSNVMVAAWVLSELGEFNPELAHLSDWDLWMRLAGAYLPAWVPAPLVAYRFHAGNRSLDTHAMLAELDLIERAHGSEVDRGAFFRHLAALSLRVGRRVDAVRFFASAVRLKGVTYGGPELRHDANLLFRHAAETLRQRGGPNVLRRGPERNLRAQRRDPHRAWKAEAEAWLSDLASV
jgi:hypothetical protein